MPAICYHVLMMRVIRMGYWVVLSLWVLLFCPESLSQNGENPVSSPDPIKPQSPELTENRSTQIRQRLSELEKLLPETAAEADQPTRQQIKDARASLDTADAQRRLVDGYLESIRTFADEKKKIEADIQIRRSAVKDGVDPSLTVSGKDNVDAIEATLAAKQSEQNLRKDELKKLESQISLEVNRPASIQKDIQDNKLALEAAEASLKELSENADPKSGELRKLLMESRKIMLSAVSLKLTEELHSHPQRYELMTLIRDMKQLDVQAGDNHIKKLEDLLNKARQLEAAHVAGETRNISEGAQIQNQWVQSVAQTNQAYSLAFSKLVDDLQTQDRLVNALEADMERTRTDYEDLKKEIEIGNADEILRQVLVETRQDLSSRLLQGMKIEEIESRLKTARLQRFRYEQSLRQVLPGSESFDRMIESKVAQTDDRAMEIQGAREIFVQQRALLQKLESNQRKYAQTIDDQLRLNKDYILLLNEMRDFLNRNLMWVPTSNPIWQVVSGFNRLAHSFPQMLTSFNQFAGSLINKSSVLTAVPYALCALAVSVFISRKIKIHQKYFDDLASKVRKVSTDDFKHTLHGLMHCFIYPFRWTVYFWAAAGYVRSLPIRSPMADGILWGLLFVAGFIHWHKFIHWLAIPSGIGWVHFRWRNGFFERIKIHSRWLVPVISISVFIVILFETYGDMVFRDIVSQPALMVAYAAYCLFFIKINGKDGKFLVEFFDATGVGWLMRYALFWRFVMMGVPFVLFIFISWGYHYAAVDLGYRLFFLMLWVGVGIVLYFLGIRWFYVKERRVAFEKALERRRVIQKTDDSTATIPPIVPEENNELDLSLIKDQTRGFLKSLFGLYIILGLWLIFRSVFPALAFFEEVKLWSYIGLVDGEEVTQWFTLFDLILVMGVILLTTAAARNIPGVVEIVLLERLPLQAGVRYAVTTVFQYFVVAAGMIVLFNLLGFDFKQFGWVLAALSLGLGFGLQEVVANFVCGILLLLERPIRVGDVVTVSGTTGIVSRIRIRATTVTDWDRKEFVVPNKEFITGHILNWTLSNKLNRVVINVGIAYGTDIEKAVRLLYGLVKNHPDILKDPEPMVTFESFGDSSLNLVVRFFLPDLDRRLLVIHEMHTLIHKQFMEAGIQIPFPQRDVHLWNHTGNQTIP
ncbi:MAG: mechanosensitive ion channel [Verrucomicrobia bacterium]|nr:mechanosensitive ion channel [Verrucomicrobiota bacterium]